ncbi:MAG: hypothetical protein ACEPOW_13205 [Bacteroidales bacterium]
MEEEPEKDNVLPYFESGKDNKRLKVTFADPHSDKDIFDIWKDYIGVWETEGLKLLILPRKRRRINNEEFSSISCFIISSDLSNDGVFWFPESHKVDKKGLFFFEDYKKIKSKPVWLSKHASTLILRLSKTGNIYRLKKVEENINYPLLSKISVIGKGGLYNLKEISNTEAAFTYSWAFGSSAIEMDLNVPQKGDGEFDFENIRITSESKLRENTNLLSETLDFNTVLTQLKDFYQELIYLDLEAFSFQTPDLQEMLIKSLLKQIKEKKEFIPHIRFIINAPDDSFAKNVFDTKMWRDYVKEYDLKDTVSWSAVWSEERPRNFLFLTFPGRLASGKRVVEDALGKGGLLAPSVISINIEGIEGVSMSLWNRLTRKFNKNFSPQLVKDLEQDIIFYSIDKNLDNVNLLLQLLYEIDFFIDMKRILGFVSSAPHELIKHLALDCNVFDQEEKPDNE